MRRIDYSKTYFSIENFSIIKISLASMAEFNWCARHVDIKYAYLYGKLKGGIYMPILLYEAETRKKVKKLRLNTEKWRIVDCSCVAQCDGVIVSLFFLPLSSNVFRYIERMHVRMRYFCI